MAPHKRLLDMLPALIVFAVVAAFGTYVGVAYVVRDPYWIRTLSTLHDQPPPAAAPAGPAPTRHGGRPAG